MHSTPIAAKLLKSFGSAVKLLKKEGKGGKKKGIYKFKVYFYMVTLFFFFFFFFFLDVTPNSPYKIVLNRYISKYHPRQCLIGIFLNIIRDGA